MKVILLLALGFAMTTPGASAQRPDSAQLEVHYKFVHVRDTTNRDKPFTEDMVLLVGRRSGVYKSSQRRVQEQSSTNPDGTTRTDTHRFGSAAEYYQYPNEKRLMRKDAIFFSEFLIADALNGLPGVIVEAHDTKNEVRFTFDSVTKTAATTILPPEKGVKTTEKEFARLQETWRKDPQAFVDGMTQGSGAPTMKVDVKPGSGPVINNPIELPETK